MLPKLWFNKSIQMSQIRSLIQQRGNIRMRQRRKGKKTLRQNLLLALTLNPRLELIWTRKTAKMVRVVNKRKKRRGTSTSFDHQ